jgi:hypothetical protein
MRMFLLLVATLVAFTASTFVLPVVVHGEHGHGGHAGGGKHAGGRGPIARHKAAGPKVKATGKHHHKLKPPKPPKPPKPVKQGGLLHHKKK